MTRELLFRLAADAVLIVHAAIVAFIVFGQALVLLGATRGWAWVRNFWFRLTHLLAMAIVALQSWVGVLCPLTHWENRLRERAGEAPYAGAFIEDWLHRLIFFDAEPWVFTLAYSLFAGIVALSWIIAPPRR